MVIQLSASLWGCELKYILGCVAGYVIIGQPPCEAVSWNVHHGRTQNKHVCQPPCEAVSWNIKNITHLLPWPLSASLWGCELKCTRILSYGILGGVSLLVRLWVEISYTSLDICPCAPSASLWGCELKCVIPFCYKPVKIRQPPCEAVSWNEIGESHKLNSPVSLLVRLWVEIIYHQTELFHEAVSLLVRLWVEISSEIFNKWHGYVSLLVRLWVEMLPGWQILCTYLRQPPCEAVSWNIISSYIISICIKSASLWGCELKCRLAVSLIRL